ncbi:MAG: hypothetical protein AB7U23_13230 [Dehalococcoidia bacterium]
MTGFRWLTVEQHLRIRNLCCNRFGWQASVVDEIPDPRDLNRWIRDWRESLPRGAERGLVGAIQLRAREA